MSEKAASCLSPKQIISEKLKRLFPNGCRRVLLVQPPNVPEEDWEHDVAMKNRYPIYPPRGLAVLSSVWQNRGYPRDDIDILDLNFMLQDIFKRDPDNFRFSVWKDILHEKLENFQPDMIATTCMFTIYYRMQKRISQFVKAFNPLLPVIAGGVHTSDAADLVAADCPEIDFICLYEGEASFPDLIDFINGKVGEEKLAQIATMIDEKYIVITKRSSKTNESFNLIPDYHNLPIDRYSELGRIGVFYWLFEPGTRAATAYSNIGCRAQCTFCSVRLFNGPGVFTRDVKDVIGELKLLKEFYGIKHFMWLDDDLLYNPARTLELFNEMVRHNLNMTWDASNGIIASAVTQENAAAMAESGCIGLSIGIESGSPEILRSVKKPSGVKHFYRCAEILHKHPNIFTKGLLMCGFPNETIGQQRQTIKLARDILLDWYTIQPLNYIPGVKLTEEALESGLINHQMLLDGSERPFVGSTGEVGRRIKKEKTLAREFINLLEGDPSRIPAREEIGDIWFLMDKEVNYDKLLYESRPIKLEMLQKMFVSICDKTHTENALGNLYFSLIERKLGNIDEAIKRLKLANNFVEISGYWHARFQALGLFELLQKLESELSYKDTI